MNAKKKQYITFIMSSPKKKKTEGPEHDSNLWLSIAIPCTTPLSPEEIWWLDGSNFIILM